MRVDNCPIGINDLIRQNRSFAVYRIPGESKLRFVGQKSGPARILPSIESFNEQYGFIIAPFRASEEYPILLINSDEEQYFKIPDVVSAPEKQENISKEPSSGYSSRFDVFTNSLLIEELDKIVLSRSISIKRDADFSPERSFYRACKRYIRSYVYLFHTPQTGTWLGSTPEILLSGEGNHWHTVALAGTQPLQGGELPEIWDEKNREEQRLVARYIHNQLATLGIQPEEKGPYTVRAAELAHLKSDFYFSLPDNNRLGDLLRLLHPTPAVCGLPKEKAMQFILDNEGYDRRYYSGFIGWLNPKDKSDLYVNLRCMQIEEKQLTLYAGGGLLASSDLQEEWQETENKLLTMARIID